MIFTKQFLAESLDKKYKKTLQSHHPFKTQYNQDEKSPAEMLIMNYYTFFDLKSNETKELAYKSRKEIVDKCFREEVMDVYPNSGKIDECIKKTNYQHLGKYFNAREIFFGNIIYHYENSIKQIPESENEKKFTLSTDAIDRLMWDSFKAKYFFKEKFATY